MPERPLPIDDPGRLAAVRATGLLDAAPEAGFDRLTAAATAILDVPFAFVTVVDEQRSFWMSSSGLPPGSPHQNTVEESFCQYVVESGEALIVGDTATHPLTRANPSISSMGVAAWAGFPLLSRDGGVLGTFCVVDQRLREWTPHEVEVLRALAEAARTEVHLREALIETRTVISTLQRMQEATASLVGALTVDEITTITLGEAIAVLGARAASLSVLDSGGTSFIDIRTVGFPAPVAEAVERATIDDSVLSAEAARTGRPIWMAGGEWRLRYPDSAARLTGLATEAAAIPLIAGGQRLGVLGLIFDDDRTRPSAERAFAQTLAQHCAQALERGRLYDRERRTAEMLQRSLLPERLPVVPGLDMAARYVPSRAGGRVGGDFYDVFETEPGAWGAVVGDVCGKGPEAASVTVLARQVIRAHAGIGLGPADALHRLNEAMLRNGSGRFLTAVNLRLAATADGFEGRVCLGGHPPPLLVREDGRIEPVGRTGTLIGVIAPARLAEESFLLGPGDVLVLYTDGVTEARREGMEFRQAGLQAVLEATRGLDAEEIADRILEAVLNHAGGGAGDDVALLILRGRR